jgi:cytochrome d ubiquinol oxidase subunit II
MMTLMISHLMLQQYWWIIISLLAGILVFLMFVQGGQSLIFSLPGTDLEKSMIINALGRKWEFTFTTLVTFGGTFFASFPLFYATSFGGAYWVWTIILFSFIIQAVSYEYRSKAGNILGRNTFDAFLMVNGAVGPFLLGTAVSTFFTGAMFSLDEMKQVTWHTNWYGLEALTDFRNLSLGFATLFLVRTNGLLFLINTIDHDDIRKKSMVRVWPNSLVFLIFFLYFIITLLLSAGFSYEANGIIMNEKFKYLHNFLDMPIVLLFFLAGVAGGALWYFHHTIQWQY